MDTNPSVSIIMSFGGRPLNLKNSLISWSRIDYSNIAEFVLVDNASANLEAIKIAQSFQNKVKFPVRVCFNPSVLNLNQTWNKYGKASNGEYVVFSMMDEIVSHKDVIQKMLACSSEARTSIFTYFMDIRQTVNLSQYDWYDDPTRLPIPHTDQTTAGLISHITGNYRKNWDYFGWFRDDSDGHLWIDQDIHLREVQLGAKFHCRTPKDVYCLHQYHEPSFPKQYMPGYKYHNDLQARLLEEAERNRA